MGHVMFSILARINYYFEFTVLTAMSEKNKNILKKMSKDSVS